MGGIRGSMGRRGVRLGEDEDMGENFREFQGSGVRIGD